MFNFRNYGYSNMHCGCSGGYSNRNYGYSYGGGYNSYGGNSFGCFSAGPSRINMNFGRGSMFMGQGFFGVGMPPITGRAAESINKIRFGASGLEQIINGIDYLSYALEPRRGYRQYRH